MILIISLNLLVKIPFLSSSSKTFPLTKLSNTIPEFEPNSKA
jgi:hypothetical protein